MSKTKKPKIIEDMEAAQQRVSDWIAGRIEDDARKAYQNLVDIATHGDVNGERRQASKLLLDLARVIPDAGSKTTVKTTNEGDGKVTYEVTIVNVQKPPPEDD